MEDLSSVTARRLWTTHPHAYGTGKGFRNGPYRVIFLHALGMQINKKVPAKCACNLDFTPDHPHCCMEIRRKAVTDRHDSITRTFGDICKDAGCQVTLEPTMRRANQQVKQSNKRADAIVTTPDGITFSIDTSVIHTTAKTYTRIAVGEQLNNRAQAKIDKYAHITQHQNSKFYPSLEFPLDRNCIHFCIHRDILRTQIFFMYPYLYPFTNLRIHRRGEGDP